MQLSALMSHGVYMLFPRNIQTLRLHNVDASGLFWSRESFVGHSKTVVRAAYGTTTRLLYSCSRDTTLRQWGRDGVAPLRAYEGHTLACTALSLSSGKLVSTGGEGGEGGAG